MLFFVYWCIRISVIGTNNFFFVSDVCPTTNTLLTIYLRLFEQFFFLYEIHYQENLQWNNNRIEKKTLHILFF